MKSNLRSEKIAPGFCTPDFGDFRISHARRQHGSKNHSKKTASGLEGVSKNLGGGMPPDFLTLLQFIPTSIPISIQNFSDFLMWCEPLVKMN